MTSFVGKTLSKVRVENLVARGGMAEVYLGTHTTLNRPVAVKILHRHLEGQSDLLSRFEREAQVLAGLRHPNIVQVFDFDVVDDQPFIVMEYVPGVSLSAYLHAIHASGGRLTLREMGQLLSMLTSALDYAHKQGVIHRDIKPANILLTSKVSRVAPGEPLPPDVEAILTDFGLLRLAQSASQTSSGTVSGTPAYMSPEQARGEKVDHRSDLYSLGVTLYEMLAGRVPFEAETSMAVLLKHIQEPPPAIDGLPVALQLVLDRLLAKDPSLRYESANELLVAFMDACNLSISDFSAVGSPLRDSHGGMSAFDSRDTLGAMPSTPVPSALDVTPALTGAATLPATVTGAGEKPRPVSWPVLAGLVVLVLFLAGIFLLRPGFAAVTPPLASQTLEATLATLPPQPSATLVVDGHSGMADMPAMQPEGQDEPSFGILRFYSVAGFLDEVIITTWELPAPADGFQYEAWLVDDESRRSLGVLPAPDSRGQASLTFIDEQGRNLLARYGRMEISLEPVPDSNPNSSGSIVYSSGIPPVALEHLRHLFVGFAETPGSIGLLVGLDQNVVLVNQQSQEMLSALQQDDLPRMRRHAEAVYNLLVGNQARGYGDLDGNGEITDPGDGFGLLLNGEHVGYIEGTLSHAGFSMSMADASSNIVIHGDHVLHATRNIETWAVELAELVAQIASRETLDAETRSLVLQALALSDRMLNGRDLDGNERIEPVPGEGGLLTALDHAIYMLDMPLFAGVNRLPAPEPAQPGETDDNLPPGYAP